MMIEHPPGSDRPGSVVVARPLGSPPLTALPSDLELPHVRRGDALLDLTLVLLAAIVLPFAPSLLASVVGEAAGPPTIGPLVIIQTWCQAGLAVGLLLYFVLRHRIRPAAFGLRRDRIGQQLLWGLGALGGVYLALITTGLLMALLYLISPGVQEDLAKRLPYIEQMPVDQLGTTLILLVAVAINEEVIFRGLLMPYLRRVLGSWWWAAAISTLIFAGLHVPQQGILGGGVQIFAIGIVLAVFFVLSRSLIAVTLAHLLFNFAQFQLIRVLPDLEELLEHLPE